MPGVVMPRRPAALLVAFVALALACTPTKRRSSSGEPDTCSGGACADGGDGADDGGAGADDGGHAVPDGGFADPDGGFADADGGSADAGPVDAGPACETERRLCGQTCVDPATDPAHCGDCQKACAEGELCAAGRCEPPPARCPAAGCPAGSYCDANRCVPGCRTDEHCATAQYCNAGSCAAGCRADGGCRAGEICLDHACRPGCRSDADCPGGFCLLTTLTCRQRCSSSSGCPLGQYCLSRECVPGCDADARCGEGRICEAKACREGCRDSATCALGSVCDAATDKCVPGCDGDYSRCAPGQACVEDAQGKWACTASCATEVDSFECHGAAWSCFIPEWGDDWAGARCRQECTRNGDCGSDRICMPFALMWPIGNPYYDTTSYCSRPCSVTGCAGTRDEEDDSQPCTCGASGLCERQGRPCYPAQGDFGL